MLNKLRTNLREFLNICNVDKSGEFKIIKAEKCNGYERVLINYFGTENDIIPAYLLIPDGEGKRPAVLIHHQHNGERHFGKSEVCGLVGNPLQAFGVDLVQRGFIVLSPDSICFEDRRSNLKGTEPDEFADFLQHYNEMCYRILKGSSLMKKVIEDADVGINVLFSHNKVDENKIGILGHSYGGNTVIFQAAFNKHISFACTSGAVGTFSNKMEAGTGIEMAEVIPGFCKRYSITDLLKCTSPKAILVISAEEDKYSKDADTVVDDVSKYYASINKANIIEHKRYGGGHSLTQERHDFIIKWILQQII